jgi:hypothetical protein
LFKFGKTFDFLQNVVRISNLFKFRILFKLKTFVQNIKQNRNRNNKTAKKENKLLTERLGCGPLAPRAGHSVRHSFKNQTGLVVRPEKI